jgi:hypothetical protein
MDYCTTLADELAYGRWVTLLLMNRGTIDVSMDCY